MIEGPTFGESQHSAIYQKLSTNYPALVTNVSIIGSIDDGQYKVGETVTANLLISDLNGYSSFNLVTGWYLRQRRKH